jgi:hypothetical protein
MATRAALTTFASGLVMGLVTVLAPGCGPKEKAQTAPAPAASAPAPSARTSSSPPVESGDDPPGQHVMPCDRVAQAYAAYLAGRTDEARREMASLASRSGDPFAEVDLAKDWSSARASASDRYVLIESARGWLRDAAGGSSARHCGELLVDTRARKILRWLPIESFAALKTSTLFVGESVAVWKSHGQRALMNVADWKETETFAGEVSAILPGAHRIVVANQPAGAARAFFEVRDVTLHKTVMRLDPLGDGPVGADGGTTNVPLALLAKGNVLLAGVSGEIVGFDLVRGKRLFSFATDASGLAFEQSADQKTATVHGVCDFAKRQPRVPAAGCVPKAACPTSSSCPKLENARVDLATGAITWQRHDPSASMPSPPTLVGTIERQPDEAYKHLDKMFCIAGELLVPRELCPATLTPRQDR